MADKGQGKSFFILGLLAAAVLLVMFGFLKQVYNDTFISRSATDKDSVEESNEGYGATPQEIADPFVSVVPEGARGGFPQPLLTDPQRGAPAADVVIIEFGDFECEACAQTQETVNRIMDEYSDDVIHVWKDFPIPALHEYSETAAEAARCAQDQGAFWEYHDKLLEQQKTFALNPWASIAEEVGIDSDELLECLESGKRKSLVIQGYFIARTLEIEQTPSFYINKQFIGGQKTYEEMKAVIDEELEKARTGAVSE